MSKYYLNRANVNLFLWRHFDINSVRLFKIIKGSALIIDNFSVRQGSHLRVPHLYGDVKAPISHFKLKSIFLSFNYHIYLDSSVSFMYIYICFVYIYIESFSDEYHMYQLIPLQSCDYLNKNSMKTNVATDEGNSRNEM